MYSIERFDRQDERVENFVEFGETLYEGDPLYRSSLPLPEQGTFFLLRKEIEVCGRAVVCFNPGIAIDGKKTALLGWYECVESIEGSRLLLDAVECYCVESEVDVLIGPINGDTWHQYRFAFPSHSPPFFLDLYHKPWYASQFEDHGWLPIETYHSSQISLERNAVERTESLVERFQKRGITFREIDPDRFDDEIALIHILSLEAFQNNPLYTPITLQEMKLLYEPLRQIVDPDFVLIAESDTSGIVGFVFAIRNLYAPALSSIIIKTVAAKPVPEGRGIGTLLVEMIHKRAKEKGYREVIHALMHDENISTRVRSDHSQPIRDYALFCKRLQVSEVKAG